MPEVYCDHKDCLHLMFFDEPRHPPGRAPADWDPGYSGCCGREVIGIKVRVIEDLKKKFVIPECRNYARRKDWRIKLPYPDEIAQRSQKKILSSQEHGPPDLKF